MKRQTFIATALAALIAPAFAADIALPEHAHPEGVVFDVAGNLYVTSMGRGAVDRVRPGADAAEPFIAPGSGGLMGAQGGRIDEKRGLLYVCSSHNGAPRTPKKARPPSKPSRSQTAACKAAGTCPAAPTPIATTWSSCPPARCS